MENQSPLVAPYLPEEILSRIAYYIPRMKDQPFWHAWTELRTLNKFYKKAIEAYYVEHCLKRIIIYADFRIVSMHLPGARPDGRFTFDSFLPNDSRIAVFRQRHVLKEDEKIFSYNMNEIKGLSEDPGFNRGIMVQVRRELTDMLPMDLKSSFTIGDGSFSFDWRTYLCSLLEEQKRIAASIPAITSNTWLDSALNTMRNGFSVLKFGYELPSHLRLAYSLKIRLRREEIVLEDAIEEMGGAVVPNYVSKEKQLILARRKRRARMGLKAHQWLRESEGPETLEEYSTVYEKEVVRRFRELKMGASLEVFSDEESDGSDSEGDDFDNDVFMRSDGTMGTVQGG